MNIFTKATDWNRNVVRHSHFLHIGKEFVVTAVLCSQGSQVVNGCVNSNFSRCVRETVTFVGLLVCLFVCLFFQTRSKDPLKQYCVNIMFSKCKGDPRSY